MRTVDLAPNVNDLLHAFPGLFRPFHKNTLSSKALGEFRPLLRPVAKNSGAQNGHKKAESKDGIRDAFCRASPGFGGRKLSRRSATIGPSAMPDRNGLSGVGPDLW
jgi:hypothetical protein